MEQADLLRHLSVLSHRASKITPSLKCTAVLRFCVIKHLRCFLTGVNPVTTVINIPTTLNEAQNPLTSHIISCII